MTTGCVPCRGTGELVTQFSSGTVSTHPCVACHGRGFSLTLHQADRRRRVSMSENLERSRPASREWGTPRAEVPSSASRARSPRGSATDARPPSTEPPLTELMGNGGEPAAQPPSKTARASSMAPQWECATEVPRRVRYYRTASSGCVTADLLRCAHASLRRAFASRSHANQRWLFACERFS